MFAALTWQSGTLHVLRFEPRGIYRFEATVTTSSEEMGLQTPGPDGVPVSTVYVRG